MRVERRGVARWRRCQVVGCDEADGAAIEETEAGPPRRRDDRVNWFPETTRPAKRRDWPVEIGDLANSRDFGKARTPFLKRVLDAQGRTERKRCQPQLGTSDWRTGVGQNSVDAYRSKQRALPRHVDPPTTSSCVSLFDSRTSFGTARAAGMRVRHPCRFELRGADDDFGPLIVGMLVAYADSELSASNSPTIVSHRRTWCPCARRQLSMAQARCVPHRNAAATGAKN